MHSLAYGTPAALTSQLRMRCWTQLKWLLLKSIPRANTQQEASDFLLQKGQENSVLGKLMAIKCCRKEGTAERYLQVTQPRKVSII